MMRPARFLMVSLSVGLLGCESAVLVNNDPPDTNFGTDTEAVTASERTTDTTRTTPAASDTTATSGDPAMSVETKDVRVQKQKE